MPETDRPLLACFAHERGDARVRKRVAALQATGWEVLGYMFHRNRDKVEEAPFGKMWNWASPRTAVI